MAEKFQNKYRIASTRLQNWDYRWNAAYFITICTQNREHYFGDIISGKMQLSPVGIIADIMWYEINNHSKHVELGAFVVMPNHVHGILILNGNDDINNIGNNDDATDVTDATDVRDVETGHALSLPKPSPPSIGRKRFQNIGKNSVSSIIGSYKSAVTKHAHRLGFKFEWQGRFHDHIICDSGEYQRIADYIMNNPKNWKDDKFR